MYLSNYLCVYDQGYANLDIIGLFLVNLGFLLPKYLANTEENINGRSNLLCRIYLLLVSLRNMYALLRYVPPAAHKTSIPYIDDGSNFIWFNFLILR